jgi:hypothetical protein
MKTNVPIQKQRIGTKTQPPDIQRRINAGWLRLWKTVYPNTPPPTEVQSPGEEGRQSRFRVRGSRFEVPRSAALNSQPINLPPSTLNPLLHHPNEPISAFELEVAISPEKGEARATNSIQAESDPSLGSLPTQIG